MASTQYRVDHETRYVHSGRATTSQHVACLKPRTLERQRLHWHDVVVDPIPDDIAERIDFFGNRVHHFEILSPYLELRVVSRSLVEVWSRDVPVDPASGMTWERVGQTNVFHRGARGHSDIQFGYSSPYVALGPELAAFARPSFAPGRPALAGAVDLMHRIYSEFRFDPGATTITTPVTRVLAERHGVCQDFAHVMIGCLRSVGVPARYVSGYLLTDPPAGQPRLVGADASHAWVSMRDPEIGWVDLDPTNDVLPDLRHITTAWGRDFGDVSPLRGVVLGGEKQTLTVGVSVMPLDESERMVTETKA